MILTVKSCSQNSLIPFLKSLKNKTIFSSKFPKNLSKIFLSDFQLAMNFHRK